MMLTHGVRGLHDQRRVRERHRRPGRLLEVGKLADLIVVDRNLFEVEASALSDLEVVFTLLEGVPVHGDFPSGSPGGEGSQ